MGTYRVGELAALAGVSVRTLHHYDRIGLLRPTVRSEGGHRRYGPTDLLRLQQILTLRYLGFPLARIGDLLGRPDFDLLASLRIQRGALRDRIADLERVEAALGDLVERRLATGEWAWDDATAATAAVGAGLKEGDDRMDAYYTPEQLARFKRLGEETSPEERAEVERRWPRLIEEVRASRHLDPASPAAQALADRWEALVAATFRGDADLRAAVAANYERGAFEGRPGTPSAEDRAFIARVNAARRTDRSSPGG